jgi:hypothetical protein
MRHRYFMLIALCVGLAGLGACVKTSQVNQAEQKTQATSAIPEDLAAELHSTRERWIDILHAFQIKAAKAVYEASLLTSHPAWKGLESIIKSIDSIQYIEGKDAAKIQTLSSLQEWENKWNISSSKMIDTYVSLSEKSMELDKENFSLSDKWSKFYRVQMSVLRDMQTSSGMDLAEEIRRFELLGHVAEIALRYRLNSLD